MSGKKLIAILSLIAVVLIVWWRLDLSDDTSDSGNTGDATSIETMPAKKESPPNIILISVDTLRADHLGCYGYHRDTSPHLDALAADSMVFENCIAHAPLTSPSCASILSGFLPHETEMWENKSFLSQDVPTVAEVLSENGYKTCAVVSNWMLNHRRGLNQGFEIYDDDMDESEANRNQPERTAGNTTDRSIALLKQMGSEPFFMWIHYQDPHGPYTPPQPYEKKFFNGAEISNGELLPFNDNQSGYKGIPKYQRLGDQQNHYVYITRYDGEIRYFDEELGRLLDYLRESGVYDDALIVFTADHGEAMGENEFYFSHGHNLDQSLLHVPMIVRSKAIGSGRQDQFVQHLDIVPTCLDAAGLEIDRIYRGQSLLDERDGHSVIYSQRGKNLSSVIVDGIKLVKRPQETTLYNLIEDPCETKDLLKSVEKSTNESMDQMKHPDLSNKKAELIAELKRIKKELRLKIVNKAKPPKLTPEDIERLQALGYAE